MASQRQPPGRTVAAINIGSWQISAIVAKIAENGVITVLGSVSRQSKGVKRGFVIDRPATTSVINEAIKQVQTMADKEIQQVLIGTSGIGQASSIQPLEIDIGGRRIEQDDVDHLLAVAQDVLQKEGVAILHAQPACYFLDGAHGVQAPVGLHAQQLGVEVLVMMAQGAPLRNLKMAVHGARLNVAKVVAAPMATGLACLTDEDRELGVALIEIGEAVTNVAVFASNPLLGFVSMQRGSGDITDAIARSFGIRRFQAERLKHKYGCAIASPLDNRELIPLLGPNEDQHAPVARGANDRNEVPRAELIAVIAAELDALMADVVKALDSLGFTAVERGAKARQVVLTGGGAELGRLADYAQSVLGMPVRIGRPLLDTRTGMRGPGMQGLAEVHCTPGFTTLAGLVRYAANEQPDIMTMPLRKASAKPGDMGALITRIWRTLRDEF